MFYSFLRNIAALVTRQFFSDIQVAGAEPVEKGPLIIVANHPNVMLDGLLVVYFFRRKLWFLAKSTLFSGIFRSRMLKFFHFVPIYRAQDVTGKMRRNEQSFAAVSERLLDKRAVLIFPEGTSLGSRKLNPVKTGAARIAFLSESKSDFNLGLKIQVLGLTYGDFFRFQSTATITASDPILVSDYQEQYRTQSQAAVKQLSADIEKKLRETTVEVHDSRYEKLVVKIAKLYQSKGLGDDDRQRIKATAREVEKFSPSHGQLAEKLERRIDQYLHLCKSLKLDGAKRLSLNIDRIFVYLAAPFIAFGVIIHFPVFRIVERLVKWINSHHSQLASWQLSLAFLIFPVWYFTLSFAAMYFGGSVSDFLKMLFLCLGSGYLSKNYLHQLCLHVFSALWPSRRTPIEVLMEIRDDLVNELEEIRNT